MKKQCWVVLNLVVLMLCGALSHAREDMDARSAVKVLDSADRNRIVNIDQVPEGLIDMAEGTAVLFLSKMLWELAPSGANTFSRVVLYAGGGGLLTAGTVIVAGGAALIFLPRKAGADTLADYYQTPQGFQDFLNLDDDEKLFRMQSDPDLHDLVIRVAQAVESH